jgi:putative hydrolase of the HAD superfamily
MDAPLKYRAVTFDCAETLVGVDWDPARLAIDSAVAVGLTIRDYDEANAAYQRVLAEKMPAYREVCLSRDPERGDEFWRDVTGAWCQAVGFSAADAAKLHHQAMDGFYGPESEVFSLFDDVMPTLDRLKQMEVRMGVLSNWDYSLHRVIEGFGLTKYFEFVLASMEEGVEKPDSRFFEIARKKLGLPAGEILHVGDNPVDDLRGAREVGFGALLIDRANPGEFGHNVKTLTEVPDRIVK